MSQKNILVFFDLIWYDDFGWTEAPAIDYINCHSGTLTIALRCAKSRFEMASSHCFSILCVRFQEEIMTSLKFVNSLRERISTLLCLSLVGAASMGLAVRSNAQTATGTASVQYTLTASGWITGPTSMTDDGGNYSSYSSPPPTITSTVHIGDAVTARHGKATISQIF